MQHCAASVHGLPGGRRVVHVPSEPGILHAALMAQSGSLQHTPSVQNPDAHCSGALHGVPFPAGGPHVPVLQNCPSGQEAVAQQKPSTQRSDSHCAPVVHRLPFGAGGRQTPSRVVARGGRMSQRWPWGQEGVLQQVLSTQLPDSHCRPTVQAAPFGRGGISLALRTRTELFENSATAMSGIASPVKSIAAIRLGPSPTMTCVPNSNRPSPKPV